jgi:hypothetical protein
MEAAYHACIRLRAAIRVLHYLGGGIMNPDGSGFDELYGIVRRSAQWQDIVPREAPFAADVRMQCCSNWNNSLVARQCITAAVSDALRDSGCVSDLSVCSSATCWLVSCVVADTSRCGACQTHLVQASAQPKAVRAIWCVARQHASCLLLC